MKNKRVRIAGYLVLVAIIVAVAFVSRQKDTQFQHDAGMVFGTQYSITYQCAKNHKADIEKVLQEVDESLSPFNPNSVISHINRNEPVELDNMFIDVWHISSQVNQETDGAFDITVAPLVNAWGFGFKNGISPDAHAIDSIKQFVGFNKVSLESKKIMKKDPRLMLDCSAVAKGFGVDVVARLLRSIGIDNFMVEIGGEVVTSGVNRERMPWRIGVTKPTDDSLNLHQELQTVLNITDKAMATSGNYRNFYYKGGKKYAHTINPKTGYPVQHSLLSATVIADNCATADAYATAFMVLGIDKAKEILQHHPDMMGYFIYADEKGENAVWCSPGLRNEE